MKKTIMICAGGTGGHMFPALALAQDLISRNYNVVIVTDARAVKYVTKSENLNVSVISSATFPNGIFGKIKALFLLAKGYLQSKKLIAKYTPELVIGFGGYPSLPPMIAAQRQNILTVIHEQNAVLGKANAYLAKKADRIALSLPEVSSLDEVDEFRAVVTGNPVRSDIAALFSHPYDTPDVGEKFDILVMGGSLGAKVMAQNVPQALSKLSAKLRSRISVVQQCHEEDITAVSEIYKSSDITFDLKPFLDNMPDLLKKAHLVIARSGASTVAEVAIAGVPAIYIPYPYHADNQQLVNANSVANKNGAWVMEEKELTPDNLSEKIEELMTNPEWLFRAAEAARSCAKPEAARKLGNLVIAFLKGWDNNTTKSTEKIT